MSLGIVVAGSSGRMGRALAEAIAHADGVHLHAALERPDSPFVGRDVAEIVGGASGMTIGSDADAALRGAHVLIDFTRPEGTMSHLQACLRHNVKAVVGTTGFDAAQKAAIAEAGTRMAMVVAPNMSAGVTVALRLLDLAARALGEDYDVEVVEAHHRHKVDAPSGTALRMGEVVAAAFGRDLSTEAVYGREGVTGERSRSAIGFATVRGGDIVGDHTVLFAGIGERLEITHRASSRATFAQGALRAARFLAGRQTGIYDMQDVLGLRQSAGI